ncbi:hypothetical protein MMC17_001392 [Xylographa soralifera]|nr:hypothetical protein [Xylographa soralifera]
MPQDFDLDLPSLWFTNSPPVFPVPSMKAKGPTACSYSFRWESDSSGTMQKVLVASVRWLDDLSTTKIHVTWKDTDPLHTARAQQKHFPPPAPLSPAELDKAHRAYGSNIAAWAESSLGHTVGDGECWTLAQQALLDLAQTYRAHGQEPPLVSQGLSHGYCILTLSAGSPGDNAGLLQLADVRRGDILQMKNAHFKTVKEAPPVRQGCGKWQKGRGERDVRLVQHTAVVVGVEGEVVRVVEQNGAVPRAVGEGRYDLGDMVMGEMSVYRAVGEGWCSPLDASWE